MLALLAALSFLIALILHVFKVNADHVVSQPTWLYLGLILIALHLHGVGGWRWGPKQG